MSMLVKSDFDLIKNLINKYTQMYIKKEFMKYDIFENINLDEIKRGLTIASILSSSNINEYKELALKFSTIVTTIVDDKLILIRCNSILSQLSIFTFSDVLKKRKGFEIRKHNGRGLSLFEEFYREEYFSKYIGNKKVKLNSFQLSVNEAINQFNNISVSAPTSIGKSFLMKKIIMDILIKNNNGKVIYIVPTRALINEVMNDLQKEINELQAEEKIYITCSSEVNDDIREKKCIFILTQERLNLLCANRELNFKVNLIVVDEAQQIANGSRGILLEYTIKRVRDLWKDIKIFFISPLIDNPEIFIKRFYLQNSYNRNEHLATVNQNIIHIKQVFNKSQLEVIHNDELIGDIPYIKKEHNTIPKKINYIFKCFNNGENSIIYCNKQGIARKIASEIASEEYFNDLDDNELDEFSDFLKNYICDEYDLVKLIKKGVSYHYSMMPNIIKMGIEDLASKGKLKIITCTTTLLEGVNIQANNIYIFTPKKNNDDLSNLEFWNLSGRAGRMRNDICGNIICIDLEKESYFKKYSNRNIELIEFKKNEILDGDIKNFNEYLQDKDSIPRTKENKKKIEAYKSLESILLLDKFNQINLIEEYKNNEIININNILEEKVVNNKVPIEVLKKLVGIEIESINILWEIFEKNSDRIEEFYLLNPFLENADKRLDKVLKIINYTFFDSKKSLKFLLAIRITIFKWIKEKSIKEIIFHKFNIEGKTSKEINEKIEDNLKFLNSNIRYEFSKYLFCYQEVLKMFLEIKGRDEDIEKMPNYPLYLEFGAANIKVLELMYLGIFREGAIILSKYIKSDERDKIYKELKEIDIDKLDIGSKFIKKRIVEKIKIL